MSSVNAEFSYSGYDVSGGDHEKTIVAYADSSWKKEDGVPLHLTDDVIVGNAEIVIESYDNCKVYVDGNEVDTAVIDGIGYSVFVEFTD